MESYVLHINERKNGQLWHQKTILPTNGPVFTVSNKPVFQDVKRKIVDFMHLAVAPNGNQIAASDSIGNVFLFDFKKKRFWQVCNLGPHICKALAFVPNMQSHLILGISNNYINIWDTKHCSLLYGNPNEKPVHQSCVHHISVNKTGTKVITSSIEEAIIWELTKKLNVLFKLIHAEQKNILKAFFLPVTDSIMCGFKSSLVCLWDSKNFKLKNKFTCFEDDSIWLRTIEASKDGKIIICGGRSSLVCFYDVESGLRLKLISLKYWEIVHVNQMLMLSTTYLKTNKEYPFQVLAILDQNGHLHFINVETMEEILIFANGRERMDFMAIYGELLVVITSSGLLKFYTIDSFFKEPAKYKPKPPPNIPPDIICKPIKFKKEKKAKIDTSEPRVKNLKKFLEKSNEYPSSYRVFIWSQLLCFPLNEEYVNFYDKENEDLSLLRSNYSDLDQSMKRAFIRLLAMLIKWCPFLKEVDYFPDLVYPFVKLLWRNTHICFELIVTLIRNWCQNWFLYLPFPPYNILYAIENLLLCHNRPLLCRFLNHNIPPEVYAFYILQYSFSKVFSGDQWLKLWDHIFSNPPCFMLYFVVAFIIMSSDSLELCKTRKDFFMHYSRPSISVSPVIKYAYELMESTPICFDPNLIVGSFTPLPKDGFPPFTRLGRLEANFQKYNYQKILREEEANDANKFMQELTANNFEELKNLREMRRKVVTQCFESSDAEAMDELQEKTKRIQDLMQNHLIHQEEIRQSIFDEKFAPKKYKSEEECLNKIHDMLNLRERLLKNNVPKT